MTSLFRIASINVRSLLSCFAEFSDIIRECSCDVVAVTETWLSEIIPTSAVGLDGYTFCRNDRNGRGVGVGIYINACFKHDILLLDNHQLPSGTLEHIWVKINVSGKNFVFGVLYRPPHANIHACVSYLDEILSYLVTNFDNIVILGDVNVNLLNEHNSISNIFSTYGFRQTISQPTRITNIC